jgi:hypothetical protein
VTAPEVATEVVKRGDPPAATLPGQMISEDEQDQGVAGNCLPAL